MPPIGTDDLLDGGPSPAPAPPVLDLIAHQARTRPDAPALVHDTARLTYAELAGAVRERARVLAAEGAAPGRLVALHRPRGIDAVVGLLAVLSTGAAYLPLDIQAPDARNAAILKDSCGDPAPTPGEVAAAGELVLPGPGVPAGAAYVIYTSGSTGTPNGVVVAHDSLAHFIAGATPAYGIGPASRVLQFSPLHFDASVQELFATLGAAGRWCCVRTTCWTYAICSPAAHGTGSRCSTCRPRTGTSWSTSWPPARCGCPAAWRR